MRIAHLLPYSATFPLSVHNGRYEWVMQLAQLQVRSGHEITIYCNPQSKIDQVHTAGIQMPAENIKKNNEQTIQLAFANDHDVYHSHFDNLHYELAHHTTKPVVFTQHWWPVEKTVQLAQQFNSKNVWAVPPTKYMHQTNIAHGIQTAEYIHHGIDLNRFKPKPAIRRRGRLLFVGRISSEKNLELAIRVARRANLGLDIIGKLTDKNLTYWQSLAPLVDGKQVCYLGAKSHTELINYYASAQALFFASNPTEAFGLVAIEAQACGLPVLMQRGGSRKELVEDGKTGYLCSTEDEFIEAALAANQLQSKDCINFAQSFDILTMQQHYDALYNQLVATKH